MNTKKELEDKLQEIDRIITCANVFILSYDDGDVANVNFNISTNYTPHDLIIFFNKLDFYYNNGFGSQYIFGTVWLDDGTWLERGECDGSEWWNHCFCPSIPKFLTGDVDKN